MSTLTFSEVVNEHFPLLEQYTPVLVRVHGKDYPELAQVRDVFSKINSKVLENGTDQLDLSSKFNELRRITDNYSIPSGGCETYAATYQMLKSADKAYHS